METNESPGARYRLWPIRRRVLVGLCAIGAVLMPIVGAFAYVGGFLSPDRLTQSRLVDGFQTVNGVHPGFRRNHAKGVCIAGRFESNGNGVALSKASVFETGTTPVIGRFAVAVGKPFIPDNETQVRSLALLFRLKNGEEWRTGLNDIPVFPARTPQDFYELLMAGAPDPATGKPDPARLQAFFAAHPESAAALALIRARPFATGFADASYNSLDAFRMVNAAGTSTPVRWSMAASDPFVPQTPIEGGSAGTNYLFDALIARIAQGPVQWRLMVTVGEAGDVTADATLPWPETRRRVDVGTLIIDHVEAEGPGNCRDVNFDPLVLPDGIEPSDDPLLSARSATYSTSFTRRAGEPKTPSEVQIPENVPAATPAKGS
ncbi:catalase family peroxidase [Ancylobacter radicis]|uniref:catalase family peroxidase n=1 Tax=Ancylobacter radicis TaxID=2836179 RepID=UPI00350F6AF4